MFRCNECRCLGRKRLPTFLLWLQLLSLRHTSFFVNTNEQMHTHIHTYKGVYHIRNYCWGICSAVGSLKWRSSRVRSHNRADCMRRNDRFMQNKEEQSEETVGTANIKLVQIASAKKRKIKQNKAAVKCMYISPSGSDTNFLHFLRPRTSKDSPLLHPMTSGSINASLCL